MSRAVLVTWDWRDQPDLDQLAAFVQELSGGTVHLRKVETHSDSYGLVLSDAALDDAAAERVYARWWNHGDYEQLTEVQP